MKKSFTLIELLVSTAIFMMAATITIAITSTSFNNRTKTNTMSSVQKNAQRIIQVLTNEVEIANMCQYYSVGGGMPIAYYGIYGDESGGSWLTSDSMNANRGRVHKDYYLDATSGDFKVDSTVYDQGTTYTKTINDPDVRVESINLEVFGDAVEAVERSCTNFSVGRGVQNAINIRMTLSGKIREQKGYYRLTINKYVSGKNLEFTTGE